jgi:rubredoxin
MEDVKPVRPFDPAGEVRACPDCGYQRGFHVTFLTDDSGVRPAVLCCPECGGRFEIGWRVRL